MNRAIKKLRTRLRKQFDVPFMSATVLAKALQEGTFGLQELADSPHATDYKVTTYCQCCGPERWSLKLPGATVDWGYSQVTINDKEL